MRTNIDINEELLREAMVYTNARTKKAIVEEALRVFIEYRAQEYRTRTYKDRMKALESKTASLTLRERPTEILRRDRNRR